MELKLGLIEGFRAGSKGKKLLIDINLTAATPTSKLRYFRREELTDLQRETLLDYYFRRMTIPQIAAQRGVHKSTVCRTLHRAEDRLRRYLKY